MGIGRSAILILALEAIASHAAFADDTHYNEDKNTRTEATEQTPQQKFLSDNKFSEESQKSLQAALDATSAQDFNKNMNEMLGNLSEDQLKSLMDELGKEDGAFKDKLEGSFGEGEDALDKQEYMKGLVEATMAMRGMSGPDGLKKVANWANGGAPTKAGDRELTRADQLARKKAGEWEFNRRFESNKTAQFLNKNLGIRPERALMDAERINAALKAGNKAEAARIVDGLFGSVDAKTDAALTEWAKTRAETLGENGDPGELALLKAIEEGGTEAAAFEAAVDKAMTDQSLTREEAIKAVWDKWKENNRTGAASTAAFKGAKQRNETNTNLETGFSKSDAQAIGRVRDLYGLNDTTDSGRRQRGFEAISDFVQRQRGLGNTELADQWTAVLGEPTGDGNLASIDVQVSNRNGSVSLTDASGNSTSFGGSTSARITFDPFDAKQREFVGNALAGGNANTGFGKLTAGPTRPEPTQSFTVASASNGDLQLRQSTTSSSPSGNTSPGGSGPVPEPDTTTASAPPFTPRVGWKEALPLQPKEDITPPLRTSDQIPPNNLFGAEYSDKWPPAGLDKVESLLADPALSSSLGTSLPKGFYDESSMIVSANGQMFIKTMVMGETAEGGGFFAPVISANESGSLALVPVRTTGPRGDTNGFLVWNGSQLSFLSAANQDMSNLSRLLLMYNYK